MGVRPSPLAPLPLGEGNEMRACGATLRYERAGEQLQAGAVRHRRHGRAGAAAAHRRVRPLVQSKTIIETYFNESVQGLDIGSKVKYRGVSVGEVTRIGFTYNKYQQDKPPGDRLRYVLVEATILGRLIGTKAGGEITRPETVHMEIEKGLRIRLAPQGITGTNYLEIDYADPKTNPELPISWEPDR